MGIIKAALNALGGTLGDAYLEAFECHNMGDTTVFAKGTILRKNDPRNSNKKGTEDIISNGSIIHVGENQFMLLVDGGKVVDYSAEPGYYKVDNSSSPSLFNGQFKDTFKDIWERIKFGGTPSKAQRVYFINLQELKGIKFGTPNPLNYFDNFYNAELFVRAHGNYSVKVTNPLLFYAEAIPKNKDYVDINDINEQYLSEFLTAFQSTLNQLSADNFRISYLPSKGTELSKYMADCLDEDWKKLRGFEVLSVGVSSISYDDQSKELINMRNKGAMMGDPNIREGYVQSTVAEGIGAAGSNPNGATGAFMGVGMGMNMGGGFMGAASASNQAQMQNQYYGGQAQQPARPAAPAAPAADGWTCSCGAVNTGKFCSQCGSAKPAPGAPAGGWVCPACGAQNTGKFCSECGAKKPEAPAKTVCPQCGKEFDTAPKFCDECGYKF